MKTQERIRVIRNFLLMGVFLFLSFTINAANAPVTTAATVCNAVPGQLVTVPITVTGFTNISSAYLTLIYETSKLRFVSFNKNPLFSGNFSVGDKDLQNGFHRLTLSWFKLQAPGITFPEGKGTIVDYVFEFISGPATIQWQEMGPSCEYSDPVGVLNDTPTSIYYINGLISGSCLSNIPTITANGPTSFCEGGSVDLTASAGTAYKWTPGGATTQKITVSTSGSYTVEVTDGSGNTATSAATEVTVNPNPTLSGVTAPAWMVCVGSTVTVTASGLLDGPTEFNYTVTFVDFDDETQDIITPVTVTKEVSGGMATFDINAPALGSYYISVISATINGCTTNFSYPSNHVSFSAEPLPSVTLTGESSICAGSETGLTASAEGGVGFNHIYFQYLEAGEWVDFFNSDDYYSVNVSPTVTTTYRAMYTTTGNGCTPAISNELTIVVNKIPTAGITGTTTVLKGETAPAITFTGENGRLEYTFTYNVNGGANQVVTTSGSNSVTVPAPTHTVGTFDYNLISVSDGNGCSQLQSGKATITVQDDTAPIITLLGSSTVSICQGQTYADDGATAWDNQSGNLSSSIVTVNPVNIAVPGDYIVTYNVKDESGNEATQITRTVTVNPTPTVTSASVTPISVIGSGQVLFSATASSGVIKWYDALSGGTEITDFNPTISETTTYYAEAIDGECVSASRTEVTATVIPQGTTQLSYRFANPRIINGNFDSFEFDVQVKDDGSGSKFLKGNVNLTFNALTLSSNATDWIATPVSGSVIDLSVSGANLNFGLDVPDAWTLTSNFQTLVTISGKITDSDGEAGIDFSEADMNGKQFSKIVASPGLEMYLSPNIYDEANFVNTYVGRVFAMKYGWTQMLSLNWNESVNTSVWEGNALVPVANALNLRIHKPATLTLPVDGELTVSGNTDIIPENGLIIESDANGTGSLITGSSSGAGSATVQRYMTTDAWHIVASPVSGQSIGAFLTANNNVARDDAENRGMMDYNPTLNEWNAYFTNSTGGDLEPGKGFSMRTNANSAVTFSGILNAGPVPLNGLTSGKWNCVGNPYTSAIAINENSLNGVDDFLNANAIVAENLDPSYGAIYVWDNGDINNGIWGKYTIISNTPEFGSDAAFDVQQGQAFMVKMNTSATSVGFNSGMQFHGPALSLKATKEIWPTIKLEVSGNSGKSSTLIAFNSRMTKGLDPTYDAGLLKSGSDLEVYSRLVEDNGIAFAIQALPSDQYESMVIPIGIDSKTGGEISFSSELVNLPSDCKVILEDKTNKTFTDLSKNAYSTTIAANSSISDRFQIHTSTLTTGLKMTSFEGQLSAYAIRNVEIKVKGNVSSQAVATLYDVQGRAILVKNLEAGSLNTIRTPNLRTGIYLLKVRDNDKLQGFKIPVKE